MATSQFGEFSAFTVGNGIRFQKLVNGKKHLVKETEVPAEVVGLFKKQLLGVSDSQIIEAPAQTPAPDDEPSEELQAEVEQRLNAEDFDAPDATGEPLPRTNEPVSIPGVDPDYLDSISIHTAPIWDIAQALYDRFGIYTVYLRRLPEDDEINPFTALPMTKYEKGIAYQAFVRASNQAHLEADPEIRRTELDEKLRAAASIEYNRVPQGLDENRQANSFDYRTSVHGANENPSGRGVNGARNVQPDGRHDMDDPIVEPKIGGAPVIRPNW